MTRIIISIESTIFPFRNDKRHVHQITIKNHLNNVFVNFFISIYPSSRLDYWWAIYMFWWNSMWRNLFLSNKYVSLRTIINVNAKVICHYLNYVVPPWLRSISHNYCNTLSPLHIPMKEHDNIIDENNQRESIEFNISALIGMQDTTYNYKDEFWNSV